MKKPLSWMACGSLILCGPTSALASSSVDPGSLVCPTELSGAAIQIASAPSGWAAHPSKYFRLYAAGFNNGPPENLAELKPVSVRESKQESTELWRFEGGGPTDGLWLACAYGGPAGDITLSKKISDSYSSCTIKYTRSTKAGARNIAITCR